MTLRDTTSNLPYLALSVFVLLIVLSHTLNQHWSGDFFAHAAAVREFSRRPWSPMHPMLAVQAPHPFMTPYTLLAGLISRLTGMSAVTTLALFALVNLVTVLVALRLLCGLLLDHRAAFYALLLSLILWGEDPWRYSGFIHLNALGFVAAYPSAAALAATLLCWYALKRFLDNPATRWLFVLGTCGPFVLLIHPMTGMALAAGLIALAARDAPNRPGIVLHAALVVIVTCLVAVSLWPYYPWFKLIKSGSNTYSDLNAAMYEEVFKRTWPLLLAVPPLVGRWRANRFDPLVWLVGLLALVYTAGAVSSNGALGRVLPIVALALHMAIADGLVKLQRWTLRSRLAARVLHAVIAITVVLGAANMAPGLVRAIPRSVLPPTLAADPRLDRVTDHYAPLASLIGPDAVVMADVNGSRHLPAFTGKVVVFFDPEPFVPNEPERRDAVARFFGPSSNDERLTLLDHYQARFIAVDQALTPLSEGVARALTELGVPLGEDKRLFVLERRTGSGALVRQPAQ